MMFGSKNVSRPASQVPSPTCSVFEEYELLPGADNEGDGGAAIAVEE